MLFREPTLADLESAWQTDPVAFLSEPWAETSQTPAEWAWLQSGVFWKKHGIPAAASHRGETSWWDWLCTHVQGTALSRITTSLIQLNVPVSTASLTNYLSAYRHAKTGDSREQLTKLLQHLATPDALSYVGPLGETPMATACAIGDPHILRTLLAAHTAHAIPWDTPNDKLLGYWPLHLCVLNTWAGGVKELVRAGANTDGLSRAGQTPAQLAQASQWHMYANAEREGRRAMLDQDTLRIPRQAAPAKPAVTASAQLDLFA